MAASSYADRPWLASYPAGVPGDYDFPVVPVTRLLDDAAGAYPDRVALAFLGARTTYRELAAQVDRFAAVLSGLGVGKGDRVALVLPNCPQNVVAFFGALRLGAVVVQHNPLYTEAELRHQLADCGAKVVVCLDRVYSTVLAVRAGTAVEKVVVTSIVDALPTSARLKLKLPVAKAKKRRAEISAVVPQDALLWTDLMKKAASDPATVRPVEVEPMTDLALLQYTGGTTGLSRGAMLTHHNLVSNAYMNRLWDTEAKPGKEVTLAVLPLFHAYGLTVALTGTILLGGTLVLLPRFELDEVFAAIDRWGPTLFPGVPPIYRALADSRKAKDHDLTSLRLCVSGAMSLPAEVAARFTKMSGAALIEGYGMTETSPCTHANPTTGPGRSGSIGLPLTGTRCRIVSPEDPSVEVAVGQPGELAIKGPQVFSGYWGQGEQAGVFTADGYLLTGDIAVMDQDGWFSIVDRKKELIIAGGFNIYPSEVEAVLGTLDGVADVAVAGVPDQYRGETVKAFVVTAPGATLTEQDVLDHAAASLTAYKVPKLVAFRDVLPRSAVGKVLRRVLVAEDTARLEPLATPGQNVTVRTTPPPAARPSTLQPAAAARRAAAKTPAAATPATAEAAAPARKAVPVRPARRAAAPAARLAADVPAPDAESSFPIVTPSVAKALAKPSRRAPAKTRANPAPEATTGGRAPKPTPARKAPVKKASTAPPPTTSASKAPVGTAVKRASAAKAPANKTLPVTKLPLKTPVAKVAPRKR